MTGDGAVDPDDVPHEAHEIETLAAECDLLLDFAMDRVRNGRVRNTETWAAQAEMIRAIDGLLSTRIDLEELRQLRRLVDESAEASAAEAIV